MTGRCDGQCILMRKDRWMMDKSCAGRDASNTRGVVWFCIAFPSYPMFHFPIHLFPSLHLLGSRSIFVRPFSIHLSSIFFHSHSVQLQFFPSRSHYIYVVFRVLHFPLLFLLFFSSFLLSFSHPSCSMQYMICSTSPFSITYHF